MTRSIKLSEPDWATLYHRLKQDYPTSVLLIREKMRKVLGFVPREYEEWRKVDMGGAYPETRIYLDFYDEKKKTLFVMKYSEYLDGKI